MLSKLEKYNATDVAVFVKMLYFLYFYYYQVDEEAGFVVLAVKGEVLDEEDKSEALIMIMDIFHNEVSVIGCSVEDCT